MGIYLQIIQMIRLTTHLISKGTFGEGRAVLDGGEILTDWTRCASPEEHAGNHHGGCLISGLRTLGLADAEEPKSVLFQAKENT